MSKGFGRKNSTNRGKNKPKIGQPLDSQSTAPDINAIIKLHLAGNLSAAEEGYRKLIAGLIESHVPYGNLAVICLDTGRIAEAIELFHRAIHIEPDGVEAYYNLGNALKQQGKLDEAIAAYQTALKIQPDYGEAHHNLGFALKQQGKLDEAIAAYQTAVQIQPHHAEAYNNLGNALKEQGKVEAAATAFKNALLLDPCHNNALIYYVMSCLELYEPAGAEIEQIYALLATDAPICFSPWGLCFLEGASPQAQKKIGWQFAESRWQPNSNGGLSQMAIEISLAKPKPPNSQKIRIGYLSADFDDHPVLYLLLDILIRYNKSEFEVYCYSIGKPQGGELRQKVLQAVDKFVDLAHHNDLEAATAIATDGIDILVDLMGYTKGTRLGITAHRPAAKIVNWLGYAGTLGHPLLADYIIGDSIVTPLANAADFSEHLAILPHCYLPYQRNVILGEPPSRAEAGLPGVGIVFCSFNQIAKVSRSCFAAWCRILTAVPDSLLWLPTPRATAKQNLIAAAISHGIDAERIVFAPKKPDREQHFSRMRLADLALDTFPYNSHSTGADTLWAGIPMVTLLGEKFASRVGASLVTAVGLPELVTPDLDSYCQLAIELALNPQSLTALKAKLWLNRTTTPLFDSQQFTADLETLYKKIWADCCHDRQEHIQIQPPAHNPNRSSC